MSRTHATSFPIHDILSQRWSPRAFASRPVELEKLRSVVEAARWAPSSYNEQPWRFIVARKEDTADFERLLSCLVEANRAWAKAAPVLLMSVAMKTLARNGNPNRFAGYDTGQAAAHLTIQASALGLYVHQMGGFDVEAARRVFAIPDSAEPMASMAMGYLGDPQSLPEGPRKAEGTPSPRRPLTDVVFSGSWGHTAPWISP